MHILTKIFTVLVSLLAVLLVPLVVVYTHNEDSYKAKWEGTQALLSAAKADVGAVSSELAAYRTRIESQKQELVSNNQLLSSDKRTLEREIIRLEAQVAQTDVLQSEIRTDLAKMATTMEANTKLTASLIGQLDGLRRTTMNTEVELVAMDETLREVTHQLEVAIETRRMLQEELERLNDEHSVSIRQLSKAYAEGFDPNRSDQVSTGIRGLEPNINLDCVILEVRRSPDRTTAEVNVGSRDGVMKDWKLDISDGGEYIGQLRIIAVDLTRSVGIVSLEDPGRGMVQVGQRVSARKTR